MEDFKVRIDKGHGGYDPGACGNGMQEADIVDAIGDYLAEELKTYEGVEVTFGPRPKSYNSTERLAPRAKDANSWGADFFVSLHINAGGGTGSETLHAPNASTASKNAAKHINDEVAALFKANGMPDRGVKSQNVYVLKNTNMPANLVEYGFIDRAKDAGFLKQESFRRQCAVATAKGIAKAFGLKKKSGTPTTPPQEISKDVEVSIVWNGKPITSKGINRNGETYLPARVLADLSGQQVGYKDGCVTINGKSIPETINVGGLGFVRSTKLAEAIGYIAIWGGKEKTVYMTKK